MAPAKRADGSKSSGKSIGLLILAIVIVGSGVWYRSSSRSGEGAAPADDHSARSSLHLETFVLNLGDPAQRSYLRVGIDLGLGQEAARGKGGPPIGQLRDTILSVLDQTPVDEMTTAKGKVKLKQDLLQALQGRAPQMKIEEVYFTEFLIQR